MPNAHNEHSRLGGSRRRQTRRRPQCYLLLALGLEAAASTSCAELDEDKIKPLNVKATRLSGWRGDSLTARRPDNSTMCQFLHGRFDHISLSQSVYPTTTPLLSTHICTRHFGSPSLATRWRRRTRLRTTNVRTLMITRRAAPQRCRGIRGPQGHSRVRRWR